MDISFQLSSAIPTMKLLGYMANLYLTIYMFSRVIVTFYIPTKYEGSNIPIGTTTLVIAYLFFFFFFIAILVDLKWYFIVGLICNFPMANYIEHLFMSFFAILYIL